MLADEGVEGIRVAGEAVAVEQLRVVLVVCREGLADLSEEAVQRLRLHGRPRGGSGELGHRVTGGGGGNGKYFCGEKLAAGRRKRFINRERTAAEGPATP